MSILLDYALEWFIITLYAMNEFERVGSLGRGKFAEVGCYSCNSKGYERYSMSLVAIKSYSGEDVVLRSRQIAQEGQVLSVLSSSRSRQDRYFITLFETIKEDTEEGNVHFILMPILGGPLHKHVMQGHNGRLSAFVARGYASELVCALRFIHSEWCVHRDMKASNILLDEHGHISVCDFGSAKLLLPEQGKEEKEEPNFDAIGNIIPTLRERGPLKCSYIDLPRSYTLTGTPEYMAPEMITTKEGAVEGRGGHNFAVDWWALGLILLEMLTGQPPQWKSRATSNNGIITIDDGRCWEFDLPLPSAARSDKSSVHGERREGELLEDAVEREEATLVAQGLDLVALLTKVDASERWHSVESVAAHPFFASVDWRAVERGTHRSPNPHFDRRLGFLDLLEADASGNKEGKIAADEELTAEQQALFEGY